MVKRSTEISAVPPGDPLCRPPRVGTGRNSTEARGRGHSCSPMRGSCREHAGGQDAGTGSMLSCRKEFLRPPLARSWLEARNTEARMTRTLPTTCLSCGEDRRSCG